MLSRNLKEIVYQLEHALGEGFMRFCFQLFCKIVFYHTFISIYLNYHNFFYNFEIMFLLFITLLRSKFVTMLLFLTAHTKGL